MNEQWSSLSGSVQELMWSMPDFDSAVRHSLALAANRFAADSAYLLERTAEQTALQKTYVWHAPGVADIDEKQIELCRARLPLYKDASGRICPVAFFSVGTLQPAAAQMLEQVGVRSILRCAIEENGRPVAYFGLTDRGREREEWNGEAARAAALAVARGIGIFLLKTRYAQRVERYQRGLEKALEASEERAATAYKILDAIAAGVAILKMPSYDRLIPEYGNLGQYRMLGIARTVENGRAVGVNTGQLERAYFADAFSGVHPDDLERVKREYAAGYEKAHFAVKKYRLLRGDGAYVWVNADLRLREVTPAYKVFYATYTDITEEQNLQRGLALSLAQEKRISANLKRANQAKANFLSRMSHEIRTPLHAVIGLNAIAAAHLDDSKRVNDCLQKMKVSAKHLLSIINDVLDMSKIDDGKVALSREPFGLQKLVSNVCALSVSRCEAAGQIFRVRLNGVDGDELLIGDLMRMQQILFNLLSNAEKFTPAGGRIQLELELLRREANCMWLRFAVSDTGIGMEPAFLEKIYKPFEQADSTISRKYGGTGLGLSITKNLVMLMGGKIDVSSKLGKGTKFSVEIPFALPPEELQARPEANLKGLRLLIADGDADSCEHAASLLRRWGIRAERVASGAEAVLKAREAAARGACYEACILGLKLPGMDGLETARQLRKQLPASALFIILADYDWSAVERQALEAGVDAFLSKPLFPSNLYEALLLAGGGKQQAAEKAREKTSLDGHVLLAEDNEINREIAVELLGMLGVTADCAQNGQEAVERFAASAPGTYGAILMDIQMPVMDGYSAAKAIRASSHPEAARIPIVAMTADAFREDMKTAAAAGMNAHIAKPVDFALLYTTLRAYWK